MFQNIKNHILWLDFIFFCIVIVFSVHLNQMQSVMICRWFHFVLIIYLVRSFFSQLILLLCLLHCLCFGLVSFSLFFDSDPGFVLFIFHLPSIFQRSPLPRCFLSTHLSLFILLSLSLFPSVFLFLSFCLFLSACFSLPVFVSFSFFSFCSLCWSKI